MNRRSQPQVKPRADRPGAPWFFRYHAREIQPDGSVRTIRKYREIAPSKGRGALTRKQAEDTRDELLALIAPSSANASSEPDGSEEAPGDGAIAAGPAPFGRLARLYMSGYLGRQNHVSEPTRQKEEFYIREYLLPKWAMDPAERIQSKAVEDWLHAAFGSWWTMHGVRGIMSRIYRHAEGHGLWPEGRPNPAAKAKLGRKRHKRERRILSFDETALVLARLGQPYRLVIQTCIATGARISEVLGLRWKHVDLAKGTIRIEQRLWHQEIAPPKSEHSRRVLGLGDLLAQFRGQAVLDEAAPESFVFRQKRAPAKPL